MKVFAPAIALLALAAVPATVDARGPARAVLVGCDRLERAATFEGRVDSVEGADRMSMRFFLQSRAHGERWHRLRVPGFSAWHTSDPGHSRYVYTRRVEALVGPASYRVVVRFRWLSADGEVLHRSRARSRPCRMPDPRPDLQVRAVSVRPDRAHYAVTVRNAGYSNAGPSVLELDLGDGGEPLSAPVDELAAREQRTVVLAGRRCTPGSVLTATADAADAIDERDERDDVLVTTCS